MDVRDQPRAGAYAAVVDAVGAWTTTRARPWAIGGIYLAGVRAYWVIGHRPVIDLGG
jgi:hypothetical protein